MEEVKKVDLDLSAPSIQLVYETTAAKSEVLPKLLSELEKAGCKLNFAEGTKQTTTFIKQGHWLIEIHPEYIEGKPILDFVNSEAFYEHCCRKKTKVHIVRDEFSEKRARKLYPLLSDLEAHFRVVVVKIGLDLKEYQGRNRGKGLHLVSWLEFSELFGSLLLNKASDKYYLEQVKKATTDEEFREARDLTVADEFGYGDYKAFFVELPELRNKVMHGRVITQKEYLELREDIKDLKHHIAFGKMASAFVDQIKALTPVFQQLAETAQATAKWVNQMMWEAGGLGAQMAATQKIAASLGAQIAASQPFNNAIASAFQAAKIATPKIDFPVAKPIFPIDPPQNEEKKLQ